MKKILLLITIAACSQVFTTEAHVLGLLANLIRRSTPLSLQRIGKNDLTEAIVKADLEAVKAVLAERTFTEAEYRSYIFLAQRVNEHAEDRLMRSIPYAAAVSLVGGFVAGLSIGQIYNHRSTMAQDAYNEDCIQKGLAFWNGFEKTSGTTKLKKYAQKQYDGWDELQKNQTKKSTWMQQQRWGIGSYVGSGLAVAAGLYTLANALWAPYSLHKDTENLTAIIEALEAAFAATNQSEIESSSSELSEKELVRKKMDRVIREMKVTFAKK